jgi:hypothetical protein
LDEKPPAGKSLREENKAEMNGKRTKLILLKNPLFFRAASNRQKVLKKNRSKMSYTRFSCSVRNLLVVFSIVRF